MDYWDEDPKYTVDDWKREVENNDTRRGYHVWVETQREMEDGDE